MKLTLKHYDTTVTIESERDDLTIVEVMELIKQLLSGAGFGQSTIEDYFGEGE